MQRETRENKLSEEAMAKLRDIRARDALDPLLFRCWVLDEDTFLWNSYGTISLVIYEDGMKRVETEMTPLELHNLQTNCIDNVNINDDDNDVNSDIDEDDGYCSN